MKNSISINDLKINLEEIIKELQNTDKVVEISSDFGNIVMMSKDYYNSLKETFYLTSNSEVKQSIIYGMKASHEECIRFDN